jgi:hypothetical protein
MGIINYIFIFITVGVATPVVVVIIIIVNIFLIVQATNLITCSYRRNKYKFVTLQHIIIFTVFKFGASSLIQHLAGDGA